MNAHDHHYRRDTMLLARQRFGLLPSAAKPAISYLDLSDMDNVWKLYSFSPRGRRHRAVRRWTLEQHYG